MGINNNVLLIQWNISSKNGNIIQFHVARSIVHSVFNFTVFDQKWVTIINLLQHMFIYKQSIIMNNRKSIYNFVNRRRGRDNTKLFNKKIIKK